ncbi:hypothetical protein, partial [Actinoallomurus sp. NPDC050550]|uniref:hypothetical protein n=1 Tax=Actinoallomurus sp. NPDC050550 TaxID=3154937 RepID=UPI0033D76684
MKVPAWATLPPQHGDTPTDQQLQQFAHDARQAGVINGNVFAADLVDAGWRGLAAGYARAWQAWNAGPAAPVEVPTWATLPPEPDDTPTGQQLQQFASAAREAGVHSGSVFANGLAAAGWRGLGKGYARAREAWNAAPAEIPTWVTLPRRRGATPTDEQLRDFARAAREARVSSGTAFANDLATVGWKHLGNRNARAQKAWNASAEVPTWVTLPSWRGARPTDQQLRDFARAAREARVSHRDDFVAGLAAAGWEDLGNRSARAREAWNAIPAVAPVAPVKAPAWATLPPQHGDTPTDQQLQEFARAARQARVSDGKVFEAGLAAAGWRRLGDRYARAREAWNAVKAAGPATAPARVTRPPQHGATPTDRQGEVIMPDRPPRPETAFSPPTFDSQPSDSHQFDPPYRTDGMAPVD